MNIYTYISIYIYPYIEINEYIYICMCMEIYIYMHICETIKKHTYIYMSTAPDILSTWGHVDHSPPSPRDSPQTSPWRLRFAQLNWLVKAVLVGQKSVFTFTVRKVNYGKGKVKNHQKTYSKVNKLNHQKKHTPKWSMFPLSDLGMISVNLMAEF